MARAAWTLPLLAASAVAACLGPSAPAPIAATRVVCAPCPVAPTASFSCGASPSAPAPEPELPCEHEFPAGTPDVALAWSDCAKAGDPYPFAARGFPAVSSDGKQVVLLEHHVRALTDGGEPTAIALRAVDADAEVKRVVVLEPKKFTDPVGARAFAIDRLAQVKALLVKDTWVPMTPPCEGPFPTDRGCTAVHPLTQTMACLRLQPGPSVLEHSLGLTFKTPTLQVSLDGAAPFLKQGLPVHRYNAKHDPKGPLDAVVNPYLEAAWADLARRVLVVQVRYCNTFDTEPTPDDTVRVYRTPKP